MAHEKVRYGTNQTIKGCEDCVQWLIDFYGSSLSVHTLMVVMVRCADNKLKDTGQRALQFCRIGPSLFPSVKVEAPPSPPYRPISIFQDFEKSFLENFNELDIPFSVLLTRTKLLLVDVSFWSDTVVGLVRSRHEHETGNSLSRL